MPRIIYRHQPATRFIVSTIGDPGERQFFIQVKSADGLNSVTLEKTQVIALTARFEELIKELRAHVAKEIGAIAKPRQIVVVQELPKTRSGKIMRRLLKDVAENRAVGDSTTLADPNVMALISQGLNTSKDED